MRQQVYNIPLTPANYPANSFSLVLQVPRTATWLSPWPSHAIECGQGHQVLGNTTTEYLYYLSPCLVYLGDLTKPMEDNTIWFIMAGADVPAGFPDSPTYLGTVLLFVGDVMFGTYRSFHVFV